jgi:hypothetical protein
MALLMRRVKWRRWHIEETWLGKGEVPADAFRDLLTKGNTLSVWRFNGDKGTLDRLVAAITATCELIDDFDCAFVEEERVPPSIKMQVIPGESPDKAINSLHLDLVELSGPILLDFARALLHGPEFMLILKKDVLALVADGVAAGYLQRQKIRLKPQEISKIDDYLAANQAS